MPLHKLLLCLLTINFVSGNKILELSQANPIQNVRDAPFQNKLREYFNRILKSKKMHFEQLKRTLKYRPMTAEPEVNPYWLSLSNPMDIDLHKPLRSDFGSSRPDELAISLSNVGSFEPPIPESTDGLSPLSLDLERAEDIEIPLYDSTKFTDYDSSRSKHHKSRTHRASKQQKTDNNNEQQLLLLLEDFINPDLGFNLRGGIHHQLSSDNYPKYNESRKIVRWKKTENDSESSDSSDDENTETEALVLRARYERACKKSSIRRCYRACKAAVRQACSSYDCGRRFKKRMMKAIKRECKEGFGGGFRAGSSDSDSDSDY